MKKRQAQEICRRFKKCGHNKTYISSFPVKWEVRASIGNYEYQKVFTDYEVAKESVEVFEKGL